MLQKLGSDIYAVLGTASCKNLLILLFRFTFMLQKQGPNICAALCYPRGYNYQEILGMIAREPCPWITPAHF